MKSIKKITIREIEYISLRMASEMMDYNEPIPDFSTRFPNILESCLATPFMSFGTRDLYKTLVDKAAVLFYLMIKNHPFQNGNKRVAITTLIVFLTKNEKWLDAKNEDLYGFTVWIASSPARSKDEAIKAIEKFISSRMIDY
jgi:death-on-curing family protein